MTGISCHPDIEYAQIPGVARAGAGASHFWDGADDVPGLVARSADFAHSLAPLEV